ncbi:putative cinnamyl alcohol dehydrogenase 6 [Hordeum vulgare]|nr:putative cinnamyl alcohol dehydrogenase 6 [Hordeum vulgare]
MSSFRPGDRVGVGCLSYSCLDFEQCDSSQENYCDKMALNYNNVFWDGSITYVRYSSITYGGAQEILDYAFN